VGIRWKESEEWGDEKSKVKVAILADRDGAPDINNVLTIGEGLVDPSTDQGSTKFYEIKQIPLEVQTYWACFITESNTIIEKDSRLTSGYRMYLDDCKYNSAFNNIGESTGSLMSKKNSDWKKSSATFAVFISATDPETAKNSDKVQAIFRAASPTVVEDPTSKPERNSKKKQSVLEKFSKMTDPLANMGRKKSKCNIGAPVSSNVIYESMVNKKGKGPLTKYQLRYFVLTDKSLDYYKTEALYKDYKVTVTAGRSAIEGAKVVTGEGKKKHPFKFIWTNSLEKVKYEIAVSSQHELDTWMAAFKKVGVA